MTIKDNFMFCAVMSEEENCIGFLEMVLGFPIAKIDVSYERNMVYHPEYKGIRLDVYAKDEANKHYNVEMQVRREIPIEKRARYYHSQMDMELLSAGISYEELRIHLLFLSVIMILLVKGYIVIHAGQNVKRMHW